MHGPVSRPGNTATAGSSSRPNQPSARPDLDTLKERQVLVTLVGQLARVQFRAADQQRTQALWKEAAQLGLDPDRITHLLYGGVDTDDRQALLELDQAWSEAQAAERRPFWQAPSWMRTQGVRSRRPSGAHRSARPAVAPSRPAGR